MLDIIDLHRRKRAALDDWFKILLDDMMTGDARVTGLDSSMLINRNSHSEVTINDTSST